MEKNIIMENIVVCQEINPNPKRIKITKKCVFDGCTKTPPDHD